MQADKKPLGFDVDSFDWNQYISHRPSYTPSFYENIYTHQASLDGNVFDIALDAGAGPGIVAEKLASKFKKVIVSEPNPSYLKVAQHRLSSLTSSTFEFLPEKAEKSSVESARVDLVVISISIHWTDVPAALSEFARILKSGGTLYIINYAMGTILDHPKADAVFREIVKDFVDKVQLNPEPVRLVLNRAIKTLSCGFDNIAFDANVWNGVERVYVNCDGDNTKLLPPNRLEIDPGPAEVRENEKRIFIEGDESWLMEGCDLDWLKQAFSSFEFGGKIEDSKEKWIELEEFLGGKDTKFRVNWPSVHIFATKI
jgi:SAM-dependent methyltransferase